MKYKYILILIILFTSCENSKKLNQMELTNDRIKNYTFLKEMSEDNYFPNFLVEKGKNILITLCFEIEKEKPKDLKGLYILTHKATNEFNNLQEEFYENESEIETAARENIGMDFEFISKSYGFEADIEELIATRDW